MSTPKKDLEIIIPKHSIEGDAVLIKIDHNLAITSSSPIVPRCWTRSKDPSGWEEGKNEKVGYKLTPNFNSKLPEHVSQSLIEEANSLSNK